MLDDIVEADEVLYRAIKRSKPSWLEYGKPTTAMFRDSSGISVDRDGKRDETAIIDHMRRYFQKRLKGAVKISAGICFDAGARVEADPSTENPYHANIWLDIDDRKREMIQAYRIAQMAEVVYMDDDVRWIDG